MFKGIKYLLKSLVKKPFKIAMITTNYFEKSNDRAGSAIHTYYLSIGLAKLGCDVHVFTLGEKDDKKTEFIEEGRIIIHHIKSKSNFNIGNELIRRRMELFAFDKKVIDEVMKENSREQFDLIHT